MASYLVKAILWLRDVQNTERTIYLSGIGSAIPIVSLITEILRKKLSNLSSVFEFANAEDNTQDFCCLFKVKLTFNPTEEDKQKPGYQEG